MDPNNQPDADTPYSPFMTMENATDPPADAGFAQSVCTEPNRRRAHEPEERRAVSVARGRDSHPRRFFAAGCAPSVRGFGEGLACDKGFTLLEVLVVVAIIGILVALLFPAMQRGIEAGHSAKCVANLRTIGVAVQQFASDHNGRILTFDCGYPDPSIEDRWFQGLAPTIVNADQMIQWNGPELNRIWEPLACPSVGDKYCSWHKATYAVNSFQDPPWGHSVNRILQFDRPSQTLYLVDGWVTFAAYVGTDLTDPGWPPPGNWPGGPPAGNIDKWIFFPHGGKCNGLFLDGHVQSFVGKIPSQFIRPQ